MKRREKTGFGYDPIFYLPERGMTTAQLPPEEKNRISHRGVALRKMKEILEKERDIISRGEGQIYENINSQ